MNATIIPIVHADGVTIRDVHDHVVAVVCTGDAAFDAELARHIARTLNSTPRPKPGTIAALDRALASVSDARALVEDELLDARDEARRLRATIETLEREVTILRPFAPAITPTDTEAP